MQRARSRIGPGRLLLDGRDFVTNRVSSSPSIFDGARRRIAQCAYCRIGRCHIAIN
jgi:hypothetical protein